MRVSIMRVSALVLPFVLVAGCAAGPETQTANAKSAGCEREYKIGSNVPVVSCPKAGNEAERQRSVDEFKNEIRPEVPLPRAGAGS